MNDISAVETDYTPVNHVAEGEKLVDDVVKDYDDDFILEKGKHYLNRDRMYKPDK